MLEPSGRFDEAGIHSQAPIIVVAGYVASRKDWQWLEDKWQGALDDEGVAFYHATDIEADPPRGIYKDCTRAEADHLTDLMTSIAARFKGTPFGVHIKASTWYGAVPFVKKHLPERAHDAPYMLLAKDVIERVILSRDKFSKERVSFMFAENDFTHQLVSGYKILQQMSSRPELMGALSVDDMQQQSSLQASDLVAWHYRAANEVRFGFRKLPVHRATLALLKRGKFFEVPKDEFFEQVASLFREHGTEWSNQVWEQLVEREKRRLERKARGEKYRRGDTIERT